LPAKIETGEVELKRRIEQELVPLFVLAFHLGHDKEAVAADAIRFGIDRTVFELLSDSDIHICAEDMRALINEFSDDEVEEAEESEIPF
jgi:hypothetical protein